MSKKKKNRTLGGYKLQKLNTWFGQRYFCDKHLVGKLGPFYCQPCWESRKEDRAQRMRDGPDVEQVFFFRLMRGPIRDFLVKYTLWVRGQPSPTYGEQTAAEASVDKFLKDTS